MKKRCVLLSIVLVFTMMLGACGSGKDPFEGTWTGRLDVTKQFEDGILERYPELTEYVDFEDLEFVFTVTFADGMMSMEIDESSVQAFNDNFVNGMLNIERGSLDLYHQATGITLEEAVAESGVTEEEYIANMLAVLEIDKMKENMQSVTGAALEGFKQVKGPYTFNEETLNIRYSESQYEAIQYAFEGKNLILTFKGEGFSLRIECEK